MTEPEQAGALSAVRGYVCDVVSCAPDGVTAIARCEDGNRHAVYKVSYVDARTGPENAVVRVSYAGDPAERAQAEREAVVLGMVGGVAGPSLYDFRQTSEWFENPAMCMQYVPGNHRPLDAASRETIAQLGSMMAWVHARPADELTEGPATTGSISSYATGRLQAILSGLAWVRHPLPDPIQTRLTAAAASLEQSLEARRDAVSFTTPEALALLHGDPAADNILWTPHPVLIDWEYARPGDPADEIAYLFDQNRLGAPQRQAFWRGYRQKMSTDFPLSAIADRVTWWEPVTLLGSTLWWVERWVRRCEAETAGTADPAVPRELDYYVDHVISRLDRLDELLVRSVLGPNSIR